MANLRGPRGLRVFVFNDLRPAKTFKDDQLVYPLAGQFSISLHRLPLFLSRGAGAYFCLENTNSRANVYTSASAINCQYCNAN